MTDETNAQDAPAKELETPDRPEVWQDTDSVKTELQRVSMKISEAVDGCETSIIAGALLMMASNVIRHMNHAVTEQLESKLATGKGIPKDEFSAYQHTLGLFAAAIHHADSASHLIGGVIHGNLEGIAKQKADQQEEKH